MATATVNGHTLSFREANYPDAEAPPVVTVTVTVALPFEDLVAALYLWLSDPDDDFADPAWVRLMVAEAVANVGLLELEKTKFEMAEARPGTAGAGWLAHCQQRARDLLAQPPAVPVRRDLVGAVR
jgi:hypothetical protein